MHVKNQKVLELGKFSKVLNWQNNLVKYNDNYVNRSPIFRKYF